MYNMKIFRSTYVTAKIAILQRRKNELYLKTQVFCPGAQSYYYITDWILLALRNNIR